MYSELNAPDIMAVDIHNAYLQATISERYWYILGAEFGSELQGCKDYILCALYGTLCSGRDFRQHLRECMEIKENRKIVLDPDLWIRKAANDDGCE